MIDAHISRILSFYDHQLPTLRAQYRSPASPAEAYRLPSDLIPLYAVCNGTGGTAAFFGADLLSVAELEESRAEWELIIASSSPIPCTSSSR